MAMAIATMTGAGSAAEAPAGAIPATRVASADTTPDGAVSLAGRSIAVEDAVMRLRSKSRILLGEIHDNPVHHRLRAHLLSLLLADGVPTWVVFEQMDRDHDRAIAAAPRDADAVATAGQLDRKAWEWPLHRPLFEAALAAGATLRGGNLSRADASRMVRGGSAQAPTDVQAWLAAPADNAAAAGWSTAQQAELQRQVDEGHCKALPPGLIAPMALAQRARDVALALSMNAAPAGVRVVLVAGNGHVRNDTGVPHHLRALAAAEARSDTSAERIHSIGFLEVAPDGSRAVDAPYDEVWFTPAVPRPDPCEAFKPPSPTAAPA